SLNCRPWRMREAEPSAAGVPVSGTAMTTQRPDFRPEAQRDLPDQVVDRIQQMVIDGELREGQVLPPEAELAALMGVSRTALREAKRTLAERGVLVTRQGVGTIVERVDADSVARPMQLYSQIRLGGVDFEQFHHVRNLLEIEIAGLAAKNATDAEITRLVEFMSDMRANVEDNERFASSDVDFHQQLASMCGNSVLALLAAVIRNLLKQHIQDVVQSIDPSVHVLPYHQAILDAVAARDLAAAQAAMDAHLEQVCVNWEQASHGRSSSHGRS
ncbi:MAG: FadR/GntR family transcriptional regulator, partial [Chloroflexota bacterium]